jgi:XTP/dITP diphosphohydrolase
MGRSIARSWIRFSIWQLPVFSSWTRRRKPHFVREKVVLLATRSAGKLKELQGLFHDEGMRGITLDEAGIAWSPDEEGIEVFDSFEANALAKARYFNRKSGMPTLADDSGLSVVSLGGAPGVWSKRYSGRDDLEGQDLDDANNAKLKSALTGFRDMSASYTCAAAYVDAGEEVVAIGQTFGRMIAEPRGNQGFGYDPYFFSTELQKTFGEADIREKAVVSHRGRAFRSLLEMVRARLDEERSTQASRSD